MRASLGRKMPWPRRAALLLIKAFRVALGELIRGQGSRRLSNGSQGAVSPTHNEVSVKGASVFTEDAHDSQGYSVPQRQ